LEIDKEEVSVVTHPCPCRISARLAAGLMRLEYPEMTFIAGEMGGPASLPKPPMFPI
jgi:hypothetical protein